MLGKFLHNFNKPLLQACITNSLEKSRTLLTETIWHKHASDDMLIQALIRGNELNFIKHVLEDDSILKNHARIKTWQHVRDICMKSDGPLLKDALSLNKSQLNQRVNMDTNVLPSTLQEYQLKQLDFAMELLNNQAMQDKEDGQEEEEEDEEDEEDEGNDDEKQKDEKKSKKDKNPNLMDTLPWPNVDFLNKEHYTWYRTVWYRINMVHLIYKLHYNGRDKFLKNKLTLWYNAHLPAVTYLSSLLEPSDEHVNVDELLKTFPGMGKSKMEDDKGLFVKREQVVQVRKTPLEMVRSVFPNEPWTVEEILNHPECTGYSNESEFTPCIEDYWTPIPHATWKTHKLYLSMVYILNKCKKYMMLDTTSVDIEDALWHLYAGFTDIFAYGLKFGQDLSDEYLLTPVGSTTTRDASGDMLYTDNPSPWQMYGKHADIRAFTAYNLPDLFYILVSIPLWGEQVTPSFKLGKVYQKSLPFACQRRHLIRLIVTTIRENDGFWRIFSHLFWVMLASLYPGNLGPREFVPTMRELIRSRELTQNKELLIEALIADQPGFGKPVPNTKTSGANGGPLVVFVAFRLHILFMAQRNPAYLEHAKRCIDWDYFHQNTIDLANLIRSNGIFARDPFAQARKKLSKTVKSPNSKVHRYRRKSEAVTLMEKMNRTLEDFIFRDQYNRQKHLQDLRRIQTLPNNDEHVKFQKLHDTLQKLQMDTEGLSMENLSKVLRGHITYNNKALSYYMDILNMENKARILNLVIRIPEKERLTVKAFSILTLPKYGGISSESVSHMVKLTNVYHESPLPKQFKKCIDAMNVPDFVVCCYYFNMVATLSKIHFIELDADTVERTDQAMILRRQFVYPGQTMPIEVFNVSIALCCQKICSLMGRGKYGAKEVSYDLERCTFICAHGKPIHDTTDDDEENDDDDDEEKEDDDDDDDADDTNQNLNRILEAQNDQVEDIGSSIFGNIMSNRKRKKDLAAESISGKGRGGKQKSEEMVARKTVRNKRKKFHRIPCRQPILNINLRGRALVWGNVKESMARYMFCPQCGSLHMYTVLNFSASDTGQYRCNECASNEIAHLKLKECAYCGKQSTNQVSEQYKLSILNVSFPADSGETNVIPQEFYTWHYFCHTHYKVAKKLHQKVTKDVLWSALKLSDEKRVLNQVNQQYYKKF